MAKYIMEGLLNGSARLITDSPKDAQDHIVCGSLVCSALFRLYSFKLKSFKAFGSTAFLSANGDVCAEMYRQAPHSAGSGAAEQSDPFHASACRFMPVTCDVNADNAANKSSLSAQSPCVGNLDQTNFLICLNILSICGYNCWRLDY